MKTNEKGRSMIEMLGVLAIIGVLSVGGIAGYSKAMAKFRANKTIDQVSHIVANTRILFGSQKDYSDLGGSVQSVAKLVYTAHLFPDEMLGTSTTADSIPDFSVFNNPYGGDVTLEAGPRFEKEVAGVTGVTDAAKRQKAFIIVYKGIPRDACIDLASQNWDSSSGSGLIAMSINDAGASLKTKSAVYDNCVDGNVTTGEGESATSTYKAFTCYMNMPMKVAKATSLCNDDLNNNMAWKFY